MRQIHLRRFAVGGAAAALAVSGLVITSPAHADSAPLNYTCEVPILGAQQFVTTLSAPATVEVGAQPTLNADVEVPEGLVSSLRDLLGGKSVMGDADAQVIANETPATASLKIPKTAVPASGSLVVKASGKLALPGSAAVGSTAALVAGDYTVNLTVNTDGDPLGPLAVPCTLDEGQDNAIGTVKVVKAGSKSKVTAKGKKGKAVVKVKVASTTSVKATGKVKVTLKGKKKVTKNVKVNKKGVAKVAVKKLKKGKYKVTAKYAGDKNVKASTAKGNVKVK
ncbi:DUF6801 domain-containing protein [Nocardioides alcanivorans]|uniref:DUF6801 domain-containing protein n=1 Tax=Nocardioides alcanivorans TaxID=2897352 RepID=UPI001F210ACA|nr:DUF6801 domain-containing protein [Nocardioides alcanivorans]